MASEQPWEAMAYGYRVDPASPTLLSKTMAIFKLEEKHVKMSPSSYVDGKQVMSTSDCTAAEQTAKSLQVEGSYGAFSAAASMSASNSTETNIKTFRLDYTIEAHKYTIQGTPAFRLKPHSMLDQDVAEYILESSVEDLAELGEFYAIQADLGGLFRKTHILEAEATDTETSIVAEISGKAGNLVGSVSASAKMENGARTNNKNARTKTSWSCQGGDANIWLGMTSPDKLEQVQEAWAGSIQDSNLFAFNLQLKPMWELVGKLDATKGANLQTYWLQRWRQTEAPKPSMFVEPEQQTPESKSRPQKGSHTHFVKWDSFLTPGGRWFECTILSGGSGYDKVMVHAFGGDEASFAKCDVIKIANVVNIGDLVIAYFNDRRYAFAGRAVEYDGTGSFKVEFYDDGEVGWVPETKVYKQEAIA